MAIPNIVPRQNNDGETLGTSKKHWSNVYTEDLTLGDVSVVAALADIEEATENLSRQKLDKNQGRENVGRILQVGADGNVGVADSNGFYTKVEIDNIVNSKVAKNQGAANAGKLLKVNTDGNVFVTAAPVGVPVGAIFPFAGNVGIPAGYLLCDGRSVSKGDYGALFNIIGYTYGGAGDIFNIPNLIGRFIEGATTSGETKEAGLPNITGKITLVKRRAEGADDGKSLYYDDVANSQLYNSNTGAGTQASIVLDASRSSTIYGASETVQPPAITMRYIIKYQD